MSKRPSKYGIAKKLLKRVQKALGLDRVKIMFNTGAAIDEKIIRFFASLDVPIMEAYGLSECSGPHTVNTLSTFKFGSVGKPMPGTKTKLYIDSNELCCSGRHVFAGYLNLEETTKDAFDEEGYLRTGDLAKVNKQVGYYWRADIDSHVFPPSS